jgi:hypothetical protein
MPLLILKIVFIQHLQSIFLKYVGKGVDRCRISMQKENRDEIQTYLNCQFICPYEAVWRLLQFPVHYKNTSY